MGSFQLTNKAVEDLSTIWNYTYNTWSERQANKYYMLLLEACQEVANDPKMGKTYEEVEEKILGYLAYRHIIMYRVESSGNILVVRILHGKMDIRNKDIK